MEAVIAANGGYVDIRIDISTACKTLLNMFFFFETVSETKHREECQFRLATIAKAGWRSFNAYQNNFLQ